MDNVETVKILREIKVEIKDEILEAVVPSIMQVKDAIHNSIKVLEYKAVPKVHLWIIYPSIVVLLIIVTYLFTLERNMIRRESGLETEVKLLIEQLQKQNIEINGDAIYRIDELGNKQKIGIKIE